MEGMRDGGMRDRGDGGMRDEVMEIWKDKGNIGMEG